MFLWRKRQVSKYADGLERKVEEEKKMFYLKTGYQIAGLKKKILIKILLLLEFRQSSGRPCWRTGF
jgi:hypothetical protein